LDADTHLEHETTADDEPGIASDDADFIAYLARRLRVESSEARARLSAWLSTYEPPLRSGVRKTAPEPEPSVELERSA
jgi:hypothetical protein